jgi:Kelch motif
MNHLMKTPFHGRTETVGLLILLTALSSVSVQAQTLPDLPFTSASTGADGALTFRPHFTPGRANERLVFDSVRQQLVMFGGEYAPGNGMQLDDTWVLGEGGWTKKIPANSPPRRTEFAMAFDQARGETILFGGVEWGKTDYGDTWAWDGTNWVQRAASSGIGNRLTTMVYDKARQNIVLFGGVHNGYQTDTWIWNGTSWIAQNPANNPPGRRFFAMAYDEAREVVVLFGGWTGGTNNLNDTWTWNGTNWTMQIPSISPSARSRHALAYDAARERVVLFGGWAGSNQPLDDTWVWDGTNWMQVFPNRSPEPRGQHDMAYDPTRNRVVLVGGTPLDRSYLYDTWLWDGTNWTDDSGARFDMRSRPNGIWNFTTIDVPAGATVRFRNNSGNSPVRWLATSNVTITGNLDLSGSLAFESDEYALPAPGGPSGFAGGVGGVPFNLAASYSGTPGQGPGGGLPGTASAQAGSDGRYSSASYGNPYIQPLIGGSGGGGGGSDATRYGGNGGGGGGAILISSSRDIVVSGGIYANGGGGGNQNFGGASQAGKGSGGAIRLQADRITVDGDVQANTDGRIRLEAFYLTVNRATQPMHVPAAPTVTREFDTSTNLLLITSVAGQNVIQPPGGELLNPDVIFSEAGPIDVTVQGTNIPDGSLARLRVTTSGGVLTPSAIPLTNGLATFTVTVPAGHGTLQAFADFTLTSP